MLYLGEPNLERGHRNDPKLYDWIDERIDVAPIWRDIADHEVPEHVNPAYQFSAFVYCFGGLTFFVVVIQVLSGMFLTMYYVPDIENAWKSVYYLQSQVAHGQIVRGMHHWGASVVIVMLLLHTMRVFFQGAYKKPRELNWMVEYYYFCNAGIKLYRLLIALLGQQSLFCNASRTGYSKSGAIYWTIS